MRNSEARRQQVGDYLLIVFTFSSVFYFLILRAHTLGAAGGLLRFRDHVVPGAGRFHYA